MTTFTGYSDAGPLRIENTARARGRAATIALWVVQAATAALFLSAGIPKLIGAATMVQMFETIGAGQWFRYLTGSLEVGGAILLLIPRTSGLGALMLAGVMTGAVVTHVFIVGGSPLMAMILFVVTGVVAWGRRQQTLSLFAGV